MKNKILYLIISILMLFISNIIIHIQINNFKRKENELSEKIAILQQLQNEQFNIVESNLKLIENEIELLFDNQINNKTELHEKLTSIKEQAEKQFTETKQIQKIYDNILEEQKKKTADVSLQENAILQMKKNADQYYKEKKYSMAYKEYKTILSYQPDDKDSRCKKAKSLYYTNRAASKNYSEILKDIQILKNNGYIDNELLEIEKYIITEQDGINE